MSDYFSKALSLAAAKHAGQTDRAGKPYIFHILEVINIVKVHLTRYYEDKELDTLLSIAALHDVVEDTDVTFAELVNMGFPECIIIPVDFLTKIDGVDEGTYEQRILSNPYAAIVKAADLMHNMQIIRLPGLFGFLTEKDIARTNKYKALYAKIMSKLQTTNIKKEFSYE